MALPFSPGLREQRPLLRAQNGIRRRQALNRLRPRHKAQEKTSRPLLDGGDRDLVLLGKDLLEPVLNSLCALLWLHRHPEALPSKHLF